MTIMSAAVSGLLNSVRVQPSGGAGSVSKSLPHFMETQQQSNWCWAANGASVGNFYHGAGSYTQCAIANTCMGRSDCCTAPQNCNQYGYLDQALQAAKSYDSMASGTCSFNMVQTYINVGKPVGTRVAWTGGGAHFMMITGYDTSGSRIDIQDPWYGDSTIVYASYPAQYMGGGSWTNTYYTQEQ